MAQRHFVQRSRKNGRLDLGATVTQRRQTACGPTLGQYEILPLVPTDVQKLGQRWTNIYILPLVSQRWANVKSCHHYQRWHTGHNYAGPRTDSNVGRPECAIKGDQAGDDLSGDQRSHASCARANHTLNTAS